MKEKIKNFWKRDEEWRPNKIPGSPQNFPGWNYYFQLFFFDFCIDRIFLYGFDSLHTVGMSHIAFTGCNNLSVGCFKIKFNAGVCFLNYKFTHYEIPPSWKYIILLLKYRENCLTNTRIAWQKKNGYPNGFIMNIECFV